MNIYVGNIAYSVSEDDLREVFEQYGPVSKVKVIIDRETGRSKGFAFVEMDNDEEAGAAVSALNDYDFQGRPMKVNEARPQSEGGFRGGSDYPRRDFGSGGGGGGGGFGRRDGGASGPRRDFGNNRGPGGPRRDFGGGNRPGGGARGPKRDFGSGGGGGGYQKDDDDF